ncbi:MAG: putative baseplate assembly protein [Synechococcales bacterium]|nr:putative baseplate assembly protein [Synechococcales bacterium]
MNAGSGQPDPIENRPGLSQINYRIGEFASVRQRLIDLLPLVLRQASGQSPLAKLTTRAADDPAIALLDAWAVVADVLTFYQERIANEGFLRTATERQSVLELVRAIGYELSPGVAASTYLTFTVEDAPGSPDVVPVPAGTQVMSVPVKDELPQTFETSEAFTAYREWNAIRPRASRLQEITPTTRQLYLAGTNTQLQAGDFLLLIDAQPAPTKYLLYLTEVISNTQANYTLVRWSTSVPPIPAPLRYPQIFAFRQRVALFGNNAPPFAQMPAEVKLAAVEQAGQAIRGGVVRSRDNGDRWTAASQGLPDADILCLAVRGTTLFAGTPNKGIFRSLDNGVTWKAVNTGLTNQNVLALHISAKDTVFNEAIFAGTPNGGVFRSKDQGNNWVPINTGTVRVEEQGENNWQSINTSLPNTVVRSLLSYSALNQNTAGSGTIYSRENTVIGFRTEFTRELEVGDTISAIANGVRQTQEVTRIDSDTSLEIASSFSSQNLNHSTPYSALTVIFSGIGNTISNSVSEDRGTISSNGLQVIGHETNFLNLRRSGTTRTTIAALGQVKTVTNIESNTLLTIDSPFVKPGLNPGTSYELSTPKRRHYLFAGSDDGLYRSLNQGRDWTSANLTDLVVYSLLREGDRTYSGTSRGAYLSTDHGVSWNSITTGDSPTANQAIFTISVYRNSIFIGTGSGVFHSQDSGTSWDPANEVLNEDSSLGEYKISSLTAYERGSKWYLVAATDNGIFISENSLTVAEASIEWRRVSQDLATQDMTAIAISDTSKTLFAGSVFKGFTEADASTEAVGEPGAIAPIPQPRPAPNLEWPEFRIQDPRQIDLETLYPQILPNSWVVLFDNRDPQDPAQEAPPRTAVRRVDQVFAIQRSAFGLSGKITRLEPQEPVDPDSFGLRSTTVFAQSEALPLALEPLTVGDRGFDIFQDPIKLDTIFLQDFIQNLQPQQTLIVRGQHCRMRLDHVGGVYRAQLGWEARHQGLENLSVRLLKATNGGLLAGTDGGLYGLPNRAANPAADTDGVWQRLYGLKAEPVYALLELSADPSPGESRFLAGTEQGLYQTTDLRSTWQRIAALPEDVVLALIQIEVASSDSGFNAVISGTDFSDIVLEGGGEGGVRVGDIVTLQTGNQSRFVTEVADTRTAKISAPFDPEPEPDPPSDSPESLTFSIGGKALFVGMRRGLYRSPDQGQTWEAIARFNETTITALAVGSTHLFAGTLAGLFVTSDTGQNWEPVDALDQITVRSLLAESPGDGDRLWIGTTQGLYLIQDSRQNLQGVSWMKGLRDRTILSLQRESDRPEVNLLEDNRLVAGTDRGVYHSDDGGETWIVLDAGLVADQGRSLQLIDNVLWVATEAGVFQSREVGLRQEPTTWERRDTGLTNSQITALAMDSSGTVLMAGATEGLFRSGDGGRTWEPLQEGLSSLRGSRPLPVQAVLAQSQDQAPEIKPDRWFAGTPEGVFYWEANQQQWRGLTAGLVYRDVRAIALHQSQIYIGTQQGGVLRLATSSGRDAGENLEASRWQPTGLGNINVQALADADGRLLLAGTERNGLFLSTDRGTIWIQITESRPGPGTLSSDGSQVVWQGTALRLQAGDVINALGQTRTVVNLTEISPNRAELTVDTPFRPTLPANTRFTINTGLTNRNITAIATAAIKSPNPEGAAPNESPDSDDSDLVIFVGTAGSGVFRSVASASDLRQGRGGDRWEQVITNLEDLEIRCLAVEPVGSTQRVWAGTASQGAFRSDNGGDLWAKVNRNLTNTDVRAILIPPSDPNELPAVLLGGMGILTSLDGFHTKPVQRGDIVQVVQPPVREDTQATETQATGFQATDLQATNFQATNFQVTDLQATNFQVKDKDAFVGALQTFSLEDFTLLPAADDAAVSEVVTLEEPPTDQQLPILTLQQPLKYGFDPATVQIFANVVRATHGETVAEILGSGDGNEANPRFTLSKPPLTYVAADNPQGAASTLNLRVNGVLWQEAPSLYSLKPQDQNYILRLQDDGTPVVIFGDGQRGARLPSGQENVSAVYRSGIGLEGNVGATSLSILKTRPQGIADVMNPLAATGGAPPETLETARTKAPPTVRTLDRIVSLQDFEDFAQGFAGIGKAQAIALWNGANPLVHITVAGLRGAEIPETSSLYEKLVSAIDRARDPIQQVEVMSYRPILFNLEGRVLLDPRYQAEVVLGQIGAAMADTFAFERRTFGQSVTSAEVISAIQGVEGVQAVDLDALYRSGRSKALESVLTADLARYNAQTHSLEAAQLLILNRAGVTLTPVLTL